MSEQISGTIERVTFHHPETGFVVLRVQVAGQRLAVVVVGQTPRAVAGEWIEAVGQWEMDAEHGRQFRAEQLRLLAPSTREGIEKYLGSGLIKGIGPHFARKIVEVFGDRTLEVIDESATFLKEVKGIGPRRIQQIRASWHQQKAVRAIMVFLQSHGLGTAHAWRIYKTYGERALDLVRANPYRLADEVWGIGFPTADQLALKLGFEIQALPRAQAILRHVLQEASNDGHCGCPEESVWREAERQTGIRRDLLQEAARQLAAGKEMIRETTGTPEPWLFLRRLHEAETGAAEHLRQLLHGGHPLPQVDLEAGLGEIEKEMHLIFSASQREALRQAALHKVLVITGGPGVGKTTLVRGIVELCRARQLRVGLCAPTGRAARRLTETTGQGAKTIHRLLEFDVRGPQRHAGRLLELDLVLVDETSMVDIVLMHQLLRAVPVAACLILVGDVDQLPSVGPGSVLSDIIASGTVPVVRLTEIFRQAQESGIVRAAYRVHRGEMPESAPPDRLGDFYFIEVDSAAVILERIITLVQERIPARFHLDPFREIQVLTPMNRAELGVKNLNVQLQAILNPPDAQESPEVVRLGTAYRLGDRVLQTTNNYTKEVFNGDVGRIRAINAESQELTVDFEGRLVAYEFDDLDELALAYALSIHKSQGSEYPAVIIPLHTQHYLLLERHLLYTALTRGKRLVVLIGSRAALELALERQDRRQRNTALAWRLAKTSAAD